MKLVPRLGLLVACLMVVSAGAVIATTQGVNAKATTASAPTGKPGRITIEGPTGRIMAPRDTLTYTLRWGRATNATSYRITVTPASTPAGTTVGLPTNLTVPDTFATFSASNLTYDSLSFAASVTAARGTRTNPTPATKSWFIVKLPGAPGSIQVDSSAVPPPLASLDVSLIPATLTVGQTGNACAFFKFGNGLVGMRTMDTTNCATTYAIKYSAAQRAVPCQTQDWLDGTSTCTVGSFAKIERFASASF
jgi:hypothetical protein